MYETRISGSISSTQPVKIGRLETAKCNMRRSESSVRLVSAQGRYRFRRETMIKLSILMVRRSDLTYEQFIQHWGEVHGPLFAAQSESSNTFGATFKTTERAMLYQGQQPPTLTVSRRFGSMTSPGQKHSSNRMATGRTWSPTKKRSWTASVASCSTPMTRALWLDAVAFSSTCPTCII